jgi:hypothetical protein
MSPERMCTKVAYYKRRRGKERKGERRRTAAHAVHAWVEQDRVLEVVDLELVFVHYFQDAVHN